MIQPIDTCHREQYDTTHTVIWLVENVSTALATVGDKAVLVGHSYAGMVISGAVESSPTKVQRSSSWTLSFLKMGNAHWTSSQPKSAASFVMLRRNAATVGGSGRRKSTRSLGTQTRRGPRFCAREAVCFSLRCFEEQLPLRENNRARVPAAFVSCVAEGYGWHVSEVNTGHDCHVESPTEVANILLSAAAGS